MSKSYHGHNNESRVGKESKQNRKEWTRKQRAEERALKAKHLWDSIVPAKKTQGWETW